VIVLLALERRAGGHRRRAVAHTAKAWFLI